MITPQQFARNGSHTFHFSDNAGNSSSAVATVTNIDLTPPTVQITYAPSTLTNTDVVATLTPSEGPIQSHTFTANAIHTFTFADALGNADSATATVTWLDKAPPVLTVEPSHLTVELGDFVMERVGVQAQMIGLVISLHESRSRALSM
ncbi:MAG: hypothetical protein ACI8W8_000417 [Rhodothermales bacterium]|jgi:hypothetical protein